MSGIGLREKQRVSRQKAILEAAEALVRSTGSVDFPMVDLSEQAQCSPATPYNMFGSKHGILYSLLNSTLDRIMAGERGLAKGLSASDHLLAASDAASKIFVNDGDFYRPLYRFLLGTADSVNRPAFMKRSHDFWMAAIKPLADSEGFDSAVPRQLLASQMVLSYIGSLEQWVLFDLTDAQFVARNRFSALMLLLAFGAQHERHHLTSEIAKLVPSLGSSQFQQVKSRK